MRFGTDFTSPVVITDQNTVITVGFAFRAGITEHDVNLMVVIGCNDCGQLLDHSIQDLSPEFGDMQLG